MGIIRTTVNKWIALSDLDDLLAEGIMEWTEDNNWPSTKPLPLKTLCAIDSDFDYELADDLIYDCEQEDVDPEDVFIDIAS